MGDISLPVEVADSSHPEGSGRKLRRHAAEKVPAYGIVNVGQSRVEVHHEPRGQKRRANYQETEIHDVLAQVPVVDGQEPGRIAAKELLP